MLIEEEKRGFEYIYKFIIKLTAAEGHNCRFIVYDKPTGNID